MITIVQDDGGDWIGIYRDGRLVDEGHSFSESAVLRLLGIKHEVIYVADVGRGGRLPWLLEEVAR